MNSSPLSTSQNGTYESLRGAYRQLPGEEKAKFVAFAARRRFTNDLFEKWLQESGVDSAEMLRNLSEARSPDSVRERLDAALLMEGNEALLVDAVTKYVTEGDPELRAWLQDRVRQVKEGTTSPQWMSHPQADLVSAALEGGLLDQALAGWPEDGGGQVGVTDSGEIVPDAMNAAVVEAVAGSMPADRQGSLAQMEELDELMQSVSKDVQRIRDVSGAIDLGALERKLRRAYDLSWGLHQFASGRGTWTDAGSLREMIEAIPDAHAVWATALADFLEELPIHHPLRRKRQAAEEIRDAAVGELRNFADQGGVEEEVPGPFAEVKQWWCWATALHDDEFTTLEDWCSVNSLDHLADFIAEQWTLAMHQERSAAAVTQAMNEAISHAMREVRDAQKADLAQSAALPGEERKENSPPPVGRHGTLIAAMEAARRQFSGEPPAPVSEGEEGN